MDGVTNLEEYLAGTNPRDPDTDHDGIPDGWELKHRLNPNDPHDVLLDPDHDGLTNLQEFKANTDPFNEDTDGDGLTDGIEILEAGTDPLSNDIIQIETVAERNGADAKGMLGRWTVEGGGIFAVDRRGALEYQVPALVASMYRIEIAGHSHGADDTDPDFQLMVWIDGEYLGRCRLTSSASSNGLAHIFTPWLAPGDHTLRVFWDNAAKDRSLSIAAVRLQAIRGADKNGNGISDWIENRIYALCGVETKGGNIPNGVPIRSAVSPACIEGRGSYLSMMRMTGEVTPKHGAGNRWYANVPISLAPRELGISFQNGALAQTNPIVWQPTNLKTAGDVTIRAGDSLLLTMRTATNDTTQVNITVNGITNFSGQALTTFPCRFEKSGKFAVTGAYSRAGQVTETKTITVQVLGGEFNERPAVWAGKSRLWTQTNLPPDAVMEGDPRMEIQSVSTGGSAIYGISLDIEEPHYMVARAGGGPIIDSVAVEGFRLYSTTETDFRVVQIFEDGSQLIEMSLVCTPVLPQISIHMDLVVAGVIYDDGTISKVFTSKDFNALGELKVHFVRPANARTSTCHKTRVYQGDTLLGNYR